MLHISTWNNLQTRLFPFFFPLETWPMALSFPASFASAGRGWENSATCPRFFMMPQAGVQVAFQ